jgi:large subunit ribosomal protein L17
MRHRNKKAILNRPTDQRKALMRNLLTSIFLTGHLITTDAKAKALVSAVDEFISLLQGKDDSNAIREIKKVLFTKESQKAALNFVKQTKKKSGFTRKTRIGYRDGDAALKIKVELIFD